jgi:hypothetical protein
MTHAITAAHGRRLTSERNSKRSMRPTHGHVLGERLRVTETSENKRLVYGIVNDNLVLLLEKVAEAYADDRQAIWALTTYGDARRFEPQGINRPPGLDEDDYDEVPDDDDPYDANSDGDWPPSAATIALDMLPDDLSDIGEERDHFPNAPTLYIDPATEAELVETLRRRGYEVWRDDELIERIG